MLVAVLLIAGFHVPVMPFVDVVGNAGILAPLQNGPMELKLGVVAWSTVKLTVVCVDVQLPKALGPITESFIGYNPEAANEITKGPDPLPLITLTPAGQVQLYVEPGHDTPV